MRAGIYGRQSSGKSKSIDEQIVECTADVESHGWHVAGTYQDGVSASRFGRKGRDEWAQVVAAVEAAALDVLVLWESSRGDRDAETWLGLLRRCRTAGVKIRVTTHGRTYDMGNARDWRTLAEDGIDNAYESEKLSLRIRRGVAAAAQNGRPAMGPCPYGYRRLYDPRTGQLLGQEPDPATAAVVRDIFRRVAESVPVSRIVADLNDRGVPPPAGQRWYRQRVRDIALSRAYIGKRKHRSEVYDAGWEPIVDEVTFWAAQRVLQDPTRTATARPGRQVHLLTYLAECVNGHPLTGRDNRYVCRKGCVGIVRAPVDRLVQAAVVKRLSVPDVYASLRQAGADSDKDVLEAEAEAARLRAKLDEWRLSAARGTTSPESLAVIEADLSAQIRDAERAARRAGVPPALRQLVGPEGDVARRWEAAALAARREVIRTMVRVRILPARRNAYTPVHERVDVVWR